MINQAKYRASPTVSFKDEGDEGAVLYNPDTDKCVIINSVGSIIWRFLGELRSTDEVIAMLTENFSGVDSKKARKDLEEFVNNFEEDFLYEVS